jgi:uncharacterized protein YdeI (YjbR/CyaY-like superfamily)
MMNPQVDHYLIAGCGRCELANTPACKVHRWKEELGILRSFLLDCGLTEERKWGVPCYTHNNKNIVIIGAFKESCTMSFFKGALLQDPHQILDKPGENSNAGRVIRFKNVKHVLKVLPKLKSYIFEAVEIEKAGLKVKPKDTTANEMPEELLQKFEEYPDLKSAFFSLTPGRQRAYLIHFSQPKQSQTRTSRIEKSMNQIMNGVGLHDEYANRKAKSGK